MYGVNGVVVEAYVGSWRISQREHVLIVERCDAFEVYVLHIGLGRVLYYDEFAHEDLAGRSHPVDQHAYDNDDSDQKRPENVSAARL